MTNVKHNLKHNGAAYNESAELINPDPKVTSGEGRALCTCGAISAPLATGGARRAWHKDHKAQATAAPTTSPEPLAQAAWEADLPVQDEVAEAVAELVEPAPAPKAKKPRRAKRVVVVDQPAADANGTALVLPFTTAITPGFWRSLGRDGAKAMVGNHFPTVTVTANNNARTLALQGPAADVAKAAAAIQAMWADALLAVKEWKKTDAGFIGRSTERLARRQEGYHLTEAFFVQFGASYGA